MSTAQHFDCVIIGGGVAGLSLAILLATQNKKVILFEKENYPFHKVCGEYISNESLKFLRVLGLDLDHRDLPKIKLLHLTSISGISLTRPLSVGGIGISRHLLDNLLYHEALNSGASVRPGTKVESIRHEGDSFLIRCDKEEFTATTVCGAYGKNSNIDVQLNRTIRATSENNLYVAVKYHAKLPFDSSQVGMHNFPGGYCGISTIEDGRVNISYITKAENLRKSGNSIPEMEKQFLSVNPFLRRYFKEAIFENSKPRVISHLYFGIKTPVDSHVLMIGDAAGNIAPLSGNGISMAFRSSQIAFNAVNSFLNKNLSREAMEQQYFSDYTKTFSSRVKWARMVHSTFGKPIVTDLQFLLLKTFPKMIDYVGAKIHGEEF